MREAEGLAFGAFECRDISEADKSPHSCIGISGSRIAGGDAIFDFAGLVLRIRWLSFS